MKLSKSALLSMSLALITSFGAHAKQQTGHTLTASEKNTLAIIAAIDKNEILVSVVAENKKADSDVNDFAKMMIEQHGSNLAQILDMENQLKLGTLSSSDAEKLSQQGKKDLAALGALQGKDFEKAYADAMVKGHEGALKLIDDKLMKTATTEEMKTFLTATRGVVEQHLEHAKKLQAELNS